MRKYECILFFLMMLMVLVGYAVDTRRMKKGLGAKAITMLAMLGVIVWAITPNTILDVPELMFIIVLVVAGMKAYGRDVIELLDAFKEGTLWALKSFLRKVL